MIDFFCLLCLKKRELTGHTRLFPMCSWSTSVYCIPGWATGWPAASTAFWAPVITWNVSNGKGSQEELQKHFVLLGLTVAINEFPAYPQIGHSRAGYPPSVCFFAQDEQAPHLLAGVWCRDLRSTLPSTLAQLCAMPVLGRARGCCFSGANSTWCNTLLPDLWSCSSLKEVNLVPVPDLPAPYSSCSGIVWSPPNNLSFGEVWPLDRSRSFIPHIVPCDPRLLCWFITIYYMRQLFPCLSQ